MKRLVLFAVVALASVPSQAHRDANVDEKDVYTLYKSSYIGGESARLHVATFDSRWGHDYNQENCTIARNLFRNQPDVSVKYWCEAGYVRFER